MKIQAAEKAGAANRRVSRVPVIMTGLGGILFFMGFYLVIAWFPPNGVCRCGDGWSALPFDLGVFLSSIGSVLFAFGALFVVAQRRRSRILSSQDSKNSSEFD